MGQFPKASQRTAAVKKLAEGLPIIFLSGTPTPESDSQVFHQLWVSSFSPFSAWKNFYAWAREFVHVFSRKINGLDIKDYSRGDRAKIDAACKHLFLSFSQAEAGFESIVEEHVIKVKMSEGVYYLADKLLKDRVVVGRSGTVLADTPVKLQNKLHQIYSGTVILEGGRAVVMDESKARLIKEMFYGEQITEAGPKIAIFYKFTAELEILDRIFGPWLTTSPELFAKHDYNKVFVSQIQSGREGINLSTADALVMLNIDFSAVSYQQAKARLQTQERTAPCPLYWVFAENGIEEKIYKSVMNKKDYTSRHFIKDFHVTTGQNSRSAVRSAGEAA